MWPIVRAWVRDPKRTGTVAPSSRHLANAMAEEAMRGDPKRILEVGAGSGAITRALRTHLRPHQHLLVIDMNRHLLKHLPADVDRVVAKAQHVPVREVDVVVSSLPLTSMTEADALAALEALRRVAGRIVLYQYSKVRLEMVRRVFPGAAIVQRVFLNLPPAYVIASPLVS